MLSSPVQKQQLHRDNEGLMYGRKTDGGCVPLSLWTTLHGTLIPYPSDGHYDANMEKPKLPLIWFLQI